MRNRRRDGFSLIELMISSALMGMVIVFLLQTFTTQHNTYVVVDQTTEAQQNARLVADTVEQDVRVAGYLVPKGAAACVYDVTNGPDTLFVSNSDVIRTVDNLTGANLDKVSGGLGALVTSGPGFTVGPNSTALPLQNLWVDVAADGPDFAVNGGVIVIDANDTNARVACGRITAIVGNTVTADFGATSVGPIGAYSKLLAVPAHVYRIVGANPSQLTRDGLVLADDIEDFQVSLFVDANTNRLVDPGEIHGDGIGPTYDPAAVNGSQLRELRINVVTRTRTNDPNRNFRDGMRQTPENRVLTAAEVASDAANPGIRRRIHSATIRLRNVGNG